jgi:hypothetical protein
MQINIPDSRESTSGANIGDQVLFSHHVKENKDTWLKDVYHVSTEKLYNIIRITRDGEPVFINDIGDECTAGSQYGSHGLYDVIIPAKTVVLDYLPITLTLETIQEAGLITDLLGSVPPIVCYDGHDIDTASIFSELDFYLDNQNFTRIRLSSYNKLTNSFKPV